MLARGRGAKAVRHKEKEREEAKKAHTSKPEDKPINDQIDTEERQVVVKCSLRGALHLPSDRKHDVLSRIDDMVIATSKIMRRGSLFALLHFTRLLEEGRDLPQWRMGIDDTPWRHFLLLGTEGFRSNVEVNPDVQETCLRYGHLFPPTGCDRFQGDGNVLTYAATQLRTAFHTNLWYPVFSRIGRLCKAWLKRLPPEDTFRDGGIKWTVSVSKFKKYANRPVKLVTTFVKVTKLLLQRSIEDGEVRDLPPACAAFVMEVRNALSIGQGVKLTDFWAKKQGLKMLHFSYWLQLQYEALGVREARLAPIFGVRRQHIKFDPTAITALAQSMKILKTQTGMQELRTLFNIPVNTKLADLWTGFLSTDGIAAAFNFVKPQAPKLPAECTLKDKYLAGKLVVVGIDPGRHSVVFAATKSEQTDQVISANLTRNKYYASSGIRRAKFKTDAWDKPMIESWTSLTQKGGALRTAHISSIIRYLEEYNTIADDWWQHGTQRKRSKLAFRTFGGRKRIMDTFFGQLKQDVEVAFPKKEVVVAYGAATFSPSGKGKPSTPTTAAFKGCARAMPTWKQNECRTSKQCCDCHGDVHSCWKKLSLQLDVSSEGCVHAPITINQHHGHVVPRNAAYQRGLLFCPNCSNFLNRDKSAALNIRYLWIETVVMGQPWPARFKARRSIGTV